MTKNDLTGTIIENIIVEGFASDGKCIIKYNNKVGLISKVAPGDLIDAKIIKDYKNYFDAIAINIKKNSSYRVDPRCPHYNICGGCRWQHLDYPYQLLAKHAQVEDAFFKILHMKNCVPPVAPSNKIFYYRNKLEYSFTDKRWIYNYEAYEDTNKDLRALGYHVPERFDRIFNVEECHLMDLFHNKIRNQVNEICKSLNIPYYNRKTQEGILRALIIRNNRAGNWMVIIVIAEYNSTIEKLLKQLIELFPNISWNYAISKRLNDSTDGLEAINVYGDKFLTEIIDDFKFRISPFSFFQINPDQSEIIYRKMIEISEITSNEVAWDLYCGTGTIALFAAKQAKKVIGIESVPQAIVAARENAKSNNINNVEFITGDVDKIVSTAEITKPDIIFLDPPRSGLNKKIIENINIIKPKTIIYLSCNAATQARDISLLLDNYSISFTQPYDMFPQTAHVENLVKLSLKNQ
ncbi:MAG TPA: 23S rRNA (uracil(1939)-C(5))-methyltransferase RlmD [Bacteroidales bacterium]|nr:23S rRNA (uracil(1939)-C(5))-methyltransferase RlmD [Bacteroidales bacterium]